MIDKKFFLSTALVTLMSFLPGYAFSSPMPASTSIEGEGSSFYINGQYRLGIPNFGDFTAKEDASGAEVKKVLGVSKDATKAPDTTGAEYTVDPYKPEYKNGYIGFAGAIGYSMGGPRVELEGSYMNFDIENKDFKVEDNAKLLALSRTDPIAESKFSTMKNEGLTNYAIMLNACYDIAGDDVPVAPYLCAGAGVDMVKFLDSDIQYKFAYQGKAGISYAVSPQINVFIDGYYHGALGDEYKEMKLQTKASELEDDSSLAATTATIEERSGHFGVEAGVRFAF